MDTDIIMSQDFASGLVTVLVSSRGIDMSVEMVVVTESTPVLIDASRAYARRRQVFTIQMAPDGPCWVALAPLA